MKGGMRHDDTYTNSKIGLFGAAGRCGNKVLPTWQLHVSLYNLYVPCDQSSKQT